MFTAITITIIIVGIMGALIGANVERVSWIRIADTDKNVDYNGKKYYVNSNVDFLDDDQ